jgi:hypothetical protein
MEEKEIYGLFKILLMDKCILLFSIQNNATKQQYHFNYLIVFQIIYNYTFENSFLKLETTTYIDSSVYGYDSKQIIVNTWVIKSNGKIGYSTVSRGDCISLTEYIFIHKKKRNDFILL